MKISDHLTKQKIVNTINYYEKHSLQHGLCYAFSRSNKKFRDGVTYEVIPRILNKLGGRAFDGWFWNAPYFWIHTPEEKVKQNQATAQRKMLLAFLLTWVNDPDFEV